ncbi:MAG TPA: TMEM175 family protein [Roseiflexaceae bacterium]|nr:TMEM175 family protein [Roseiflexaceae bacterium]
MTAPLVEEKGTGRIEAFSDGVFAIAVTLLVLELKVPQLAEEATNVELWSALLRRWPSYLAYLVSFTTILIVWVNHHRLFTIIRRSDSRFLFLNGLLLLVVTTIPFPTALLAEYLERPAATVACAIYTGTFVLLAFSFYAFWRYAAHRNRLLAHTVTDEQVAAISRSFLFGPISYLLAFALAFVNVFASFGVCMLLALFWAVAGFEPATKRS